MREGELAILYASVWQCVFGVAEVTAPLEHDPERDRWAWRFGIRPLVVVDDLDRAPPVEGAGILPSSIWRHSYIRLSDEQFTAADALIRAASRT